MKSTLEHPEVIHEYIELERQKGRVLGPFLPGEIRGVHINRFGVTPKGHQSGKWLPDGASVNDGIDPLLCSLRYVRVDQIVQGILRLGVGSEMAKMDVRSSYRIVPVHPENRCLLGMRWDGFEYIDAMQPFGLRSAPKVFNAIADALEWILKSN